MNLSAPFRLAWSQLAQHPAKLATGVSGVVFACVLIFAQLGFKGALFDSATAVQAGLNGDIFLIHRNTDTLMQTHAFPRARLYQALAVDGVSQASPVYVGTGSWKNPWNASRRAIFVFGIDPGNCALNFSGLRDGLPLLKRDDTFLFDERSRPEFGDITGALTRGGELPVQLSNRKVNAVGTFVLGVGFTADGNVITNEATFMRIFRERSFSGVDIGILTLRPGADVLAVRDAIRSRLPQEVRVLTHAEFVGVERAYWENNSPIGAIFSLGVMMGLIVGVVIVYQVLYTEIANHLSEYATLKAIGYSHRFLVMLVGAAALILALMGFVPGVALSLGLYHLVGEVAFLPMHLGPGRLAVVFFLTLAMCFGSALLAVRRLQAADPADVF
jgi:putative ABC transport system permease protein